MARRDDRPRVRFRGGGLDGAIAPAGEVEPKVDYRAWRLAPCASTTGPQYDLYRWEPGGGTMAYVGTVFDLDGPALARVPERPLPKIDPPKRWNWR